jgi:predicted phage tail protein
MDFDWHGGPITRATKTVGILLALLAVALCVTAFIVIPLYAVFMVVWMHAPLSTVLATAGPVAMVLGLAGWLSARAAARRFRPYP